MSDIFVSYAREDRERVGALVAALEGQGWTVWWDHRIETGSKFDREIEKAIETCRCVLVVWSHASVESEWVRTEANEGLDRGILIPIAIDDVRQPLAYRRVQTNLLLGWPNGDHTEEFRRVSAAIAKVLDQRELEPAAPKSDAPGERRKVSVLTGRVSVHAAVWDEDKVDEIIDGFQQRVEELVGRFGGTLYQQGGSGYVVVFGMPVAQESDPLLAARVSLELRECLETLVAQSGWAEPQEFTTEASIVNGMITAKRRRQRGNDYLLTGSLMQQGEKLLGRAPPGTIVASAAAFAPIERYVEAEMVGEATEPIYQIRSASAVESRIEASQAKGFTRLCARTAEIDLVLERFASAADGTGQVVTISGEPGVGKSRLLHEVRTRLEERGAAMLDAHCHAYGSNTPYYPYLETLRRILQLGPVPAARAHDAAVAAILAVDPGLQPYVPHYLYLLSINSTQYTLPSHLEGQAMRLALQEAIVALLTSAAKQQPLVISLEDWHWADGPSTAALVHLIDVASSFPILLIVTTRPEFKPTWTDAEHCATVRLGNLSLADTGAMISALTGTDAVPSNLVADLFQRTGGNPFFVEEVCSSLLEQGKITTEGRRLVVRGSIEDLGIPDSIHAVLSSRLDQLDRMTREVVHCAAVIGREFSRQLLEIISGRPVDSLLRGLVETALIKQTRVVPEPAYHFRHALIHAVAYNAVEPAARTRLHRLAAESIIKLYPDGLVERTEVLAYHFGLSDDVDHAIHYMLLAGERALARSAHAEAVKHLLAVDKLLAGKPDDTFHRSLRMRTALALGPGLVVTEGYSAPGVLKAYQAAWEHSRVLAATNEAFSALWGLWRCYNATAQMERSLEISHQLRKLAQESGRDDQLHSACASLASAATWGGDLAKGLEYTGELRATYDPETAYALAARYGTSPMVVGLGIGSTAAIFSGDYTRGIAFTDEALEIAAALKHPVSEATAIYYLGLARRWGGEVTTHWTRRLREFSEKERMPQWQALACFDELRDRIASGKGDQTAELQELVRLGNEAAHYVRASITHTRLGLTEAFIMAGQTDQAVRYADEGLRSLRIVEAEFYRLKAAALWSRDPEAAEHAWQMGWQKATEMNSPFLQLRLLLDRVSRADESARPASADLQLMTTTLRKFTGPLQPAVVTRALNFLASWGVPAFNPPLQQ